jgi:hypothetical protein
MKKNLPFEQVLNFLNLITFSEEKRLEQVLRFKNMEKKVNKQINKQLYL